MAYLVISSSLNPDSRSRVLARTAAEAMERQGAAVDWLDLQDLALPFCDGAYSYGDPNIAPLKARIADADGIIIAAPVYNFDVNAAIKNVVELTGEAWRDQTVAFLYTAGGRGSYMAIMGLANSLMFDFKCLIVPRFVFALEDEIIEGRITAVSLVDRIEEMVRQVIRLGRALKPISEESGL